MMGFEPTICSVTGSRGRPLLYITKLALLKIGGPCGNRTHLCFALQVRRPPHAVPQPIYWSAALLSRQRQPLEDHHQPRRIELTVTAQNWYPALDSNQ